jgi:uncharacterized membrane protein YciS (DUF1049 family)
MTPRPEPNSGRLPLWMLLSLAIGGMVVSFVLLRAWGGGGFSTAYTALGFGFILTWVVQQTVFIVARVRQRRRKG